MANMELQSELSRRDGAELSRFVDCQQWAGGRRHYEIVADAGEREQLAERFALPCIDSLSAVLELESAGKDLLRLSGKLVATFKQVCVVTLEHFPNSVNEAIDQLYSSKPLDEPNSESESEVGEELPEMLDEGGIDLGEVVAQHLSLAIDPHPRKPNAEAADLVEHVDRPDAGTEGASRPFADLRRRMRGEPEEEVDPN